MLFPCKSFLYSLGSILLIVSSDHPQSVVTPPFLPHVRASSVLERPDKVKLLGLMLSWGCHAYPQCFLSCKYNTFLPGAFQVDIFSDLFLIFYKGKTLRNFRKIFKFPSLQRSKDFPHHWSITHSSALRMQNFRDWWLSIRHKRLYNKWIFSVFNIFW